MKTSELKTNTAYLINSARDWQLASYESSHRGFFLASGYDSWRRRTSRKATHVLVIQRQSWPRLKEEEQTAEWYEAARHYTEDDFRNKVEPPKGWVVYAVQASAVRCTWEEGRGIPEKARKEREEANKRYEQSRRERDERYRLKQEARERVTEFVNSAESRGWVDVTDSGTGETLLALSDLKLILEVK